MEWMRPSSGQRAPRALQDESEQAPASMGTVKPGFAIHSNDGDKEFGVGHFERIIELWPPAIVQAADTRP